MSQAILGILRGAPDEEEAEMGDVQFKAIKTFDGKLRRQGLTNPTCAEGQNVATGDLASVTALAGKDLYLASAKCVIYTNPLAGTSTADQVVLNINGNIVERARYSQLSPVGNATFEYEFKNVGHFVLPTEIIKLEVLILDADTQVDGFIECWEEDTGTSPAI